MSCVGIFIFTRIVLIFIFTRIVSSCFLLFFICTGQDLPMLLCVHLVSYFQLQHTISSCVSPCLTDLQHSLQKKICYHQKELKQRPHQQSLGRINLNAFAIAVFSAWNALPPAFPWLFLSHNPLDFSSNVILEFFSLTGFYKSVLSSFYHETSYHILRYCSILFMSWSLAAKSYLLIYLQMYCQSPSTQI